MADRRMDLTAVEPSESGDPRITAVPYHRDIDLAAYEPERSDHKIGTEPWNPDKDMADTRSLIARRLFWLLVAVLAGGVVLVGTNRFTKIEFQDAKDLFLSIFTAVLAILSSVIGFYFGRAEREKDA